MNLVFLLDVDNTLLDNDQLKADLQQRIESLVGKASADRFWEIYEEVRTEKDFVDYPTTVERWTTETGDSEHGTEIETLLKEIPFKDYLYPHVLETLTYLKTLGTTVILSDGDPVFQPYKIEQSGLAAAVDGNVLIYVHKEDELSQVFERYPANHYVAVDDKPRIISALEGCCPTTFTTVLVHQGKYAEETGYLPRPDYEIGHIADLRAFSAPQFAGTGASTA